MRELTREQELQIIRSLSSDDVIDNGGGRIVFDLSADISRELDLPNKDYVVKIALGDKGLNQNELEIEQYIKYRNEIALAEIAAVGHIITLMEKVDTDFTWTIRDAYDNNYRPEDIYNLPSGYIGDDPDNFDDPAFEYLVRQLISEYDLDREEAEDKALSIFDTLYSLDSLYGETLDNAQIGLNENDDWVAFDYGFDPEKTSSEQCSDTRNFVDSSDWCDIFLNTLIENIYNEDELWEFSPHGLMKQVEEEFFDYIEHDELEARLMSCCEEEETHSTVDWSILKSRYFDDMALRPASEISITLYQSAILEPSKKYSYIAEKFLDKSPINLYNVISI